jgi:hypothetical protein
MRVERCSVSSKYAQNDFYKCSESAEWHCHPYLLMPAAIWPICICPCSWCRVQQRGKTCLPVRRSTVVRTKATVSSVTGSTYLNGTDVKESPNGNDAAVAGKQVCRQRPLAL